jgi:hypothetical protein
LESRRNWTLLLCGLAFPVTVLLDAMFSPAAMSWIGGTDFSLAWLLSFAVHTSDAAVDTVFTWRCFSTLQRGCLVTRNDYDSRL